MKSSLTDKAQGAAKQAAGKIKQAAGRMTNDPNLHERGVEDEMEGKVQKKVGDVKKVFGK